MRWRRWDSVLGLNGRNDFITAVNPPAAIRLVNDKQATKAALRAAGVPTAPTLALLQDGRHLARLRRNGLPATWACKPNHGLGGNGILLAAAREGVNWRSPSGRRLRLRDISHHVRLILDGEFSARPSDAALFEPLLRPDPALAGLSVGGLPDIRVICAGPQPRLAMLRLPTVGSGGRANLHQGAVGGAVDLGSGTVTAASSFGQPVVTHPDTGAPLVGARVPGWSEILDLASRCAGATGLHYLGADIVLDAARGPLALEVNARPGLQIQNVTGRGLRDLVDLPV